MRPLLEVEGLKKTYPGFQLGGVSFSVYEDCITGFIGANGAGKTTTIRAILHLISYEAGTIKFKGKDISKIEKIFKDSIGVVFDEGFFYDKLTLTQMKNLLASAYSHWDNGAYARYLDAFSLRPDQTISSLSRGMKMKFSLALALSHHAELLIMDEPTSGLDPLIQQAFYDILKEENKRGVTIFLSSHVLSEVQRLCDRVAILREGKLISVQSMKELRGNGYKKISLTAKNAIPEDLFSIPGTANLEWDKSKTSVSFMFSGTVMTIMNQLHRLELEDILIEEPSLEEVFLHYYE